MTRAMVRSALAIALVGAILGLAQTAVAGEAKKEVTGKITAVDQTGSTFTLKHKKESMTFTVPDKAKFGSAGRNLNLNVSNLTVGDRVTVHYSDQGGKLVAHKISHVDIGEAAANRNEKKAAH